MHLREGRFPIQFQETTCVRRIEELMTRTSESARHSDRNRFEAWICIRERADSANQPAARYLQAAADAVSSLDQDCINGAVGIVVGVYRSTPLSKDASIPFIGAVWMSLLIFQSPSLRLTLPLLPLPRLRSEP